jgi:hypothetical protein
MEPECVESERTLDWGKAIADRPPPPPDPPWWAEAKRLMARRPELFGPLLRIDRARTVPEATGDNDGRGA